MSNPLLTHMDSQNCLVFWFCSLDQDSPGNFIWRYPFSWLIKCSSSLCFRLQSRLRVEVDHTGSVLVGACRQGPQQRGSLLLVPFTVPFQRPGQPVFHGLGHLSSRRCLRQGVGLLAGIKALQYVPSRGGVRAAVLVNAEGEAVEEGMAAELAMVRAFPGAVEAAVQLQVDVLGELGATQLTLVRLLPRV